MSRFYTNVYIPDQFDQQKSLIEQIELLKFEKSRLNKEIESLYLLLENIPNAIEEYGYVNLSYDRNKKQMKIGKLNE